MNHESNDDTPALVLWLGQQTWSAFAQSLFQAWVQYGHLTPKQDAAARSMYAKCLSSQSAKPAVVQGPPSQQGIYRRPDGEVFRVRVARSSAKLYAERLIVTPGQAGTFSYDRGSVYTLTDEMRLSVEEVAAIGHQFGFCAWCGALLTDEKSIARGIGPVCIKKVK